MKADETKTILKTIKFAYDRFEISQEKAQLWHDVLKPYDFNSIMKNLMEFLATSKYPPAIADLTDGLYRDTSRPYSGVETLTDEEIRKRWGL